MLGFVSSAFAPRRRDDAGRVRFVHIIFDVGIRLTTSVRVRIERSIVCWTESLITPTTTMLKTGCVCADRLLFAIFFIS